MSLAIGIAGAFFSAKRSFPFRNVFLSFYAIPLCLPALLVALGYVSFFGMQGSVNSILTKIFHIKPVTFLYSFSGIVFVQGFYNFPIIMKNV